MADFGEIYALYMEDVYKYILSLSQNPNIAEEITQETFYKALQKIDRFRGDCKLRVWLCQIAKNTYFSYCSRQINQEKEETLYQQCTPQDVEETVLKSETVIELHRKLHNLPEPYKEVFSLRVLGELPYDQIAELFGKSESWARVTFHRAKLKLKEEL